MDDQRLQRIEAKLDKAGDHLSSIDVTLAAQHVSLEDHIRRTSLLEQDVAPIKKHVTRVEGIVKFITMISVIAAIMEAIHRW